MVVRDRRRSNGDVAEEPEDGGGARRQRKRKLAATRVPLSLVTTAETAEGCGDRQNRDS